MGRGGGDGVPEAWGRWVSTSIKLPEKAGCIRGNWRWKGGLTHAGFSSPPHLAPFLGNRCWGHTGRPWGVLDSALKGLSDWVLPSLMSITLWLSSADPSFDLPECAPPLNPIPVSSCWHLPLLSQAWEPTSWLLPDGDCENCVCVCVCVWLCMCVLKCCKHQ